jgi:hypothetical protein
MIERRTFLRGIAATTAVTTLGRPPSRRRRAAAGNNEDFARIEEAAEAQRVPD